MSSGLQATLLVAVLYGIGVARIWSAASRGRLVSVAQVASFAAGIAVLTVALGPPLDTTVSHDLTAHMTQHVLMIWLAAPLLVIGAPFPTLLWALPDALRFRVQPWWRRTHRAVFGDAWPLWVAIAVIVQSVVLGLWHLPAMYQGAVQHPMVHAAEHASFLFTAIFFWWTITAAVRRTRFGAGVLAVFIAKFPGLILGVGMTISSTSWYPNAYGSSTASVRDQQGAGVVMWVAGGMMATIAGLTLFWFWMQALERATPSDPAPVRIEGMRV